MQTLQLYAYDQNGVRWELDLYEEDPMKLTISAEDIIDIPRIDASFSRQFRIPATGNNNKFFKYWYTSGIIDFDVTKKITAEIHVDGAFYKSGQLRLEAAYVNEDTNNIDFEVVFLGETKDFSTQVGEGFLVDFDLSEINHQLNTTNLYSSWYPINSWVGGKTYTTVGVQVYYNGAIWDVNTVDAAGPPVGVTPQENPISPISSLPYWNYGYSEPMPIGLVRYGLAERGHVYTDSSYYPYSEISVEPSTGGVHTFIDSSWPILIDQFTPMVQIKYLIDKIFAKTNYTFSNDSIFNEDWFQYLYTDGIAEAGAQQTSTALTSEAAISEPYEISTGSEEIIEFDSVISNPGGAYDGSTFTYTTASDVGTYTFSIDVDIVDRTSDFGSGGGADLRLYRQEVGSAPTVVATQTGSGGSGIPNTPYTFNLQLNYTSTTTLPNTKFWATIETFGSSENPQFSAGTFDCTSAPVNVSTNDMIKNDIKALDFFRSILTKFRLVMVPSKSVSNEFIIKPWEDYVGTGDIFDWTNKLDYNMDVVLKPIFFSQSSVIEFKDQEDQDQYNFQFQQQNNHVYGRLLYDSQNELISDTREITTIFAPTPVNLVVGAKVGSTFIIPHFTTTGDVIETGTGSAKHEHLQLLPMKPKPRLLFWNGMKPALDEGASSYTWYFTDTVYPDTGFVGTPDSMTFYPCFTPYSEFLTTSNTLNLNWNIESDFVGEILGESVYTRYWNNYIQDLYSPEARMMTAYFKIDAQDLRNLTFDDVIFIKDTYWRVQKIYDAPLTDIDVVKVDLIKLVSWYPAEYTGPYTATEDWMVPTETWPEGEGPWYGDQAPSESALGVGDAGLTQLGITADATIYEGASQSPATDSSTEATPESWATQSPSPEIP